MNRLQGFSLLTLAAAFVPGVFAQTPQATLPMTSSTPEVHQAAPVESPLPALAEQDKKKLSDEFKKAVTQQKSSLVHQEKSALRELVISQKQKARRWREDQKKKRRVFFEQHMSGPERREYVQKYLVEKDQFDTSLKAELAEFKKSWSDRKQALGQTLKELDAKFNESLKQGIRPEPSLWPKGN